jgi:hypothetical protein
VLEQEELYYALLVYEAMFSIDHRNLRDELTKPTSKELVRNLKAKNSFDMYNGALHKSPIEWLGPNNDPRTSEYQEKRKAGKVLLDIMMKEDSK